MGSSSSPFRRGDDNNGDGDDDDIYDVEEGLEGEEDDDDLFGSDVEVNMHLTTLFMAYLNL